MVVVLLLLLLLLEGLFSPSSPSLLCGRFSPGARAVGAGGGGGGGGCHRHCRYCCCPASIVGWLPVLVSVSVSVSVSVMVWMMPPHVVPGIAQVLPSLQQ